MTRQYLSKGGGMRGSNVNTNHVILNVIKGEHNALKKNIDNLQNVDTDIKSYLDSLDNRITAVERKMIVLDTAVKSIQKANSDASRHLSPSRPSAPLTINPNEAHIITYDPHNILGQVGIKPN